MRRLFLPLLAWFALSGAAEPAPNLVPDVSAREVQIRTSFSGAQLLLFGAILYPGGEAPEEPAEIAVVLRGPAEPLLIRQKKKIAGIWMNADSHRFRSVPGFYAVASSAPLDTLIDERTAAIYELGLEHLQLSPGPGADAATIRAFEEGLVERRTREGLYADYPEGVEISDEVLYRARIPIPSRVPVGTYTAETFLISGGRVLAVATREIEIGKSGFERMVALAAQRRPFLYGLAAIAVSLFLGWFAAFVFSRRN
ncbi:TIGR02186 family protein [Sphingomicrobium aestuariivivum]|uniref:TIGR02186 family protein n=1 Tax=Sphingomicrobium aestuariivivum TaxID=1582356 RepID=UPI001FD63E45|nr:TIGR02186 family protein [Sphingomicrobium aestuariivivum]MCJ8191053.1 TIGR02186 family protein [Sphingomicrobium aestuariivivum]